MGKEQNADSLHNDEISGRSNVKAIADGKINVTQKQKLVQILWVKEKNAGSLPNDKRVIRDEGCHVSVLNVLSFQI